VHKLQQRYSVFTLMPTKEEEEGDVCNLFWENPRRVARPVQLNPYNTSAAV